MMKATVLTWTKLYLNSTLNKLWNFLDKQYINNEIKAKVFNKF